MIFILGILLASLLALPLSVYLAARRRDESAGADCAIVLGAKIHPDGSACTTLLYRLDGAQRALEEGRVSMLILCGGRTKGTPVAEARVMLEELLKRNVPRERLLVEDRSRTTWENFVNAREIMAAHGLQTALVVTSDYHVRRALWMARDVGVRVTGGVHCRAPRGVFERIKQLARESYSILLYYKNDFKKKHSDGGKRA